MVVADDGVGGATVAEGTGLMGLSDRVEAQGGTLRIHSPRGAGTRIEAALANRCRSLTQSRRSDVEGSLTTRLTAPVALVYRVRGLSFSTYSPASPSLRTIQCVPCAATRSSTSGV